MVLKHTRPPASLVPVRGTDMARVFYPILSRGDPKSGYLLRTPGPQEGKGGGLEPRKSEEAENKEKPSAAGKGGAAAPSDYSHSSGIWMSTQGLQRRRGHKYRSAMAIFPAAPAARRGKAGRAWLKLRPEGRVAGGWLRE